MRVKNGRRKSVMSAVRVAYGWLAHIAAGTLLGLYVWQVFVTMPHLPWLSDDTYSYLILQPNRPVGFYYLSRLVFAFRRDVYALALVQAFALAAAAFYLYFALRRALGSPLVAVAALVFTLFRESFVIGTQDISSDPLFGSLCLAVFAAACFLFERATWRRAAIFLGLAFVAENIRPIGPAVTWPLALLLGIWMWRNHRRIAIGLVIGLVFIQVASSAIGYLQFGRWGSQDMLGYALLPGTAYIVDEKTPIANPAARDFAQRTADVRRSYQMASTALEKYRVLYATYNYVFCRGPARQMLDDALRNPDPNYMTLSKTERTPCGLGDLIHSGKKMDVSRFFRDLSIDAIIANPSGFAEMTWVKIVGGATMFHGFGNQDLASAYTEQKKQDNIEEVKAALAEGTTQPDLFMGVSKRWETSDRTLQHDAARGLRSIQWNWIHRAGPHGENVDIFFIIETAIVLLFLSGMVLLRYRAGLALYSILLFVVPPWTNLIAVSIVHIPTPRYMDVLAPIVYIALLDGARRAVRLVWDGIGASTTHPLRARIQATWNKFVRTP